MTVNRQEILTPIVYPEKRGHEWYLPALPIARALHAELYFEPATNSVSVSNPLDASIVEYDGNSGEIRRNQGLDLALTPGLATGSDVSDLRLPLSLVTILFDLSAYVTPSEDEITLLSRRAAGAPIVADLPRFGMQEVQYHGYANHDLGGTYGGLRIDDKARLGRGLFRSSVLAQAADSEDPVLRSYYFGYLDGRGNEWAAGDLRGTPEFRWFDTFGRGLQWAGERRGGRHRFSVDFRRLVAGQIGIPGRASRPRFDGEVASAAYTTGARPGTPAGQAISMGLAIRSDAQDEPGGVLFAAQHRLASPRVRLQTMAGLDQGPGRGRRHGLASEVSLEWLAAPEVRFNTRLGHYGTEFRLPVLTFPERSSRFWTVGGRTAPSRWLSLSASQSIHHHLVEGATEYLTTGSVSAAPGRTSLRTVSASIHSSDVGDVERRTDLLVDARGSVGRGDWFVMTRETIRDGFPLVLTAGLSTRSRFGSGQLTGTWQGGHLQGVSVYWTQPVPGQAGLQATVGGRWGRPRSDRGLDFLGNARLTWNFGGSHELDYAYDQQQTHDSYRLAGHGTFLFDEGKPNPGLFVGPQSHVAQIRGRIYLDHDLDGEFSRGDRPLEGIRVRLDRGNLSTVTSETGEYSFQGVRAGEHSISVAAEGIRADLALLDPIDREILLPALRTVAVDWRTSVSRTLHGLVFHDLDGDGKLDEDEPGLPDVHVLIAGISDTVSDSNGYYRLSDIPPGVRTLIVDQASLTDENRAPDPIEVRLASGGDARPVHVPIRPRERAVERKIFIRP